MTDLLDLDEVRSALVDACRDAGSQKAFATRHGLSQAYVSEILRGTRDPAERVLDALGMVKVVGYRWKP